MQEFQIVYFFNHLGRGTFIDLVAKYISLIPFLAILFLILSLSALFFDKKNGKWVFLGSIIIVLIYFGLNDFIIKQNILDHIFVRERPYLAYPNSIYSLGESWHDSSFPSGHMAMTVAFLSYFIILYRKTWIIISSVLFILLMAFARMHNGMHYPTDIIAGLVLGLGYGLIAYYIIKKIGKIKSI